MEQSAKNGVFNLLLTLIHARWRLHCSCRVLEKVYWEALLKSWRYLRSRSKAICPSL